MTRKMDLDFSDKISLVTGASRGIGLRIAQDLANRGSKLIVTATSEKSKSKLQKLLGADIIFIPVDFLLEKSTEDFFNKLNEINKIDICINNAGITRHNHTFDATENEWDSTHKVNIRAPFLVSKAVAKKMKENSYGRIVNISSIWGHHTRLDRAAYSSSKYGLRGLTSSMAVDLAKHNILVNAVSPGITKTDMVTSIYSKEILQNFAAKIPLGRLATAKDISNVVLFLSSSFNTYITGQSILADGGYTIV